MTVKKKGHMNIKVLSSKLQTGLTQVSEFMKMDLSHCRGECAEKMVQTRRGC